MSTVLKSHSVTKLTTTFSLSKLNAVPEWGAEAVLRAPHSEGCSPAASSTRLGSDRIIDRAEPCFITQVSAYTLQQVHVINATTGMCDKHMDDRAVVVSPFPPSDPLLKHLPFFRKDSLKGKALLTLSLTWTRPVIWSTVSSLDCSAFLVSRIIPAVDTSLRIAMDKYAMFAVTCSEKFLDM